MSKTKGQNYMHGAAILTVGVVIMKLLGFIYKIPLGNILGDEGYSMFLSAYNIYFIFFTLATAGLPVALSRLVAEADANGRAKQEEKLFRVAWMMFFVLGTVFALIMFLYPEWLADKYLENPDAALSIKAMSPAILLVCLVSAYRGYCQGNGNMLPTTVDEVLEVLRAKNYEGLDVDFEFVAPENRQAYIDFIASLTARLNAEGYIVVTALAPKTYAEQPGLLYEAHDYSGIGAVSNAVLLMTYEWGYSAGPPMAVSPIGSVRRVLDYGVTAIEPSKIYMGMPNYGYDWPLPFERGVTRAPSIGNVEAVDIAARYGAVILYDEASQAPHFNYFNEAWTEHEVWFEDARSVRAKLALVPEYGLAGVGYWNLMRPFPQNWQVLNALYEIRRGLP